MIHIFSDSAWGVPIPLLALILLGLCFALGKRIFGQNPALFSVLLIVSAVSFWSVISHTGELLGFIFVFGGLYVWFAYHTLSLSGLLIGIATFLHPQSFLMFIPTIALVLRIDNSKTFMKTMVGFLVPLVPVALVWAAFRAHNPFSFLWWSQKVDSFFAAFSLFNIHLAIPTASTVFFLLLFFCIAYARRFVNRRDFVLFYNIGLVYSILQILYTYLHPTPFGFADSSVIILLALLPHAIFTLCFVAWKKWKVMRRLPIALISTGVCVCIAVAQIVLLIST